MYGIQGIPTFHPLAMMGGALWCTGNMMCGPIIQLIGMGMGLLIWGCANMVRYTLGSVCNLNLYCLIWFLVTVCQLMGWSTGTFGLFGLDKNDIKTPAFNYAGIVVVVVGMCVFLRVSLMYVHTTNNICGDAEGPEASLLFSTIR